MVKHIHKFTIPTDLGIMCKCGKKAISYGLSKSLN